MTAVYVKDWNGGTVCLNFLGFHNGRSEIDFFLQPKFSLNVPKKTTLATRSFVFHKIQFIRWILWIKYPHKNHDKNAKRAIWYSYVKCILYFLRVYLNKKIFITFFHNIRCCIWNGRVEFEKTEKIIRWTKWKKKFVAHQSLRL